MLSTPKVALLARLDKRFVKEAMLLVMEDCRFFARSQQQPVVWGVASNLFEWQLVRYDMTSECKQEECFQMSKVFRLYWKEKMYTYADLDMKYFIAVLN